MLPARGSGAWWPRASARSCSRTCARGVGGERADQCGGLARGLSMTRGRPWVGIVSAAMTAAGERAMPNAEGTEDAAPGAILALDVGAARIGLTQWDERQG